MAGDVAAGFGGEEDYGSVEVVRLAGAFYGDAVDEVVDPFLAFVHHFILVGAKPAGGEAVDGDAVAAPVVGEGHGELADASSAGTVGAEAGVSGDAGDGADIDDASVALLDHAAGEMLGDEEAAAEVGVEDEVPVVPGDVEGGLADVASGVVDEDVDLGDEGVGFGGHGLDTLLAADVELKRDGLAAECFDFGDEGGQVGAFAGGDDEVGTGFGEGAAKVLAEAAAGSGDEGGLVGEVEGLGGVHGFRSWLKGGLR